MECLNKMLYCFVIKRVKIKAILSVLNGLPLGTSKRKETK